MAFAFIIMQIGNKEMDTVCERAIVPAITACGLEAKRVDKHNEGKLLGSEIAKFIGAADIVVADLTNERQNCYLEVGYTMGVGKYPHLILTARESHFHDSPNYNPRGPKIHFDLGGYDILRWDLDNLEQYRSDLEKQIRRRLEAIKRSGATKNSESRDMAGWFLQHLSKAKTASIREGCNGGMEVFLSSSYEIPITLPELKDVCEKSPIGPYGQRIGMYQNHPPSERPKPMSGQIVAENKGDKLYSYWAASLTGGFYQDISYLEDAYQRENVISDEVNEKFLFVDTQIMRVTETLLYCVKFYSLQKYKQSDVINININNWGLQNRVLSMSDPVGAATLLQRRCADTDSQAQLRASIEDIDLDLTSNVKALCSPTFELFDFFEPADVLYERSIQLLRKRMGV